MPNRKAKERKRLRRKLAAENKRIRRNKRKQKHASIM
jgi:hypothetical protein